MIKLDNRFDANTVVLIKTHKNYEPVGLYLYQYSMRGDEDLSYHGSPWYEEFFHCVDPKSNKEVVFGDQEYFISDALGTIQHLCEQIGKAVDILKYLK